MNLNPYFSAEMSMANPCPDCHARNCHLVMDQLFGPARLSYHCVCVNCGHRAPPADDPRQAFNLWQAVAVLQK